MDSTDRKKITVISKYAQEEFNAGDWLTLGQITGGVGAVTNHPRLLRSLDFGDDDYPFCVTQILDEIFSSNPDGIDDVIDHFDVDLWYQQKEPEKYRRVFSVPLANTADFWREGYLRAFLSHKSDSKAKVSVLKTHLADWGVSTFIAHEDIQPTREWRDEVEAGLDSMDVLLALVEPGFKDSDWCVQEVGIALGRRVDIVPLRRGMDPFGFFGKYQGIQASGRKASQIAEEIFHSLLKKPKFREKCLQGLRLSLAGMQSERKTSMIKVVDEWQVISDERMKALLEGVSLSNFERAELEALVRKVGAFESASISAEAANIFDDDIPF